MLFGRVVVAGEREDGVGSRTDNRQVDDAFDAGRDRRIDCADVLGDADGRLPCRDQKHRVRPLQRGAHLVAGYVSGCGPDLGAVDRRRLAWIANDQALASAAGSESGGDSAANMAACPGDSDDPLVHRRIISRYAADGAVAVWPGSGGITKLTSSASARTRNRV